MGDQQPPQETEDEKERRLNQAATMEKLRTPQHEIKKLKTLEELLKEKP
jgi:hypothetical protein